jgi:hypothetical protein
MDLIAVAAVVALCLVAGLFIGTRIGRAISSRLERLVLRRVPGFTFVQSMTCSSSRGNPETGSGRKGRYRIRRNSGAHGCRGRPYFRKVTNMADWRTLCKKLILADGTIEPRETVVLQREFLADQGIDRSELEFLVELRKEAKAVSQTFEDLFFGVIKKTVIGDRGVSGEEARWLRDWIFADGKVDQRELQMLKELKDMAVHVSPEFDALYKECVNLLVETETGRKAK